MRKVSWSPPDISEEDKNAMKAVIDSGWVSEGNMTAEFEKTLAKYLECKYVIVVNNATCALTASLFAHGIGAGDEVIIPAYTFIASQNTPWGVGAKPVLADCDPLTLNTTPDHMKHKLSKRTKAMIPVDVAGMPADIEALRDFAEDNNLILIEDAAEALGGIYRNKKIGSFGHTTVFSFHIAKTITTIEGGCIATNDEEMATELKMIKNHGALEKSAKTHFNHYGFNYRTTDVQAALGISQLKRVNKFLARRKSVADIYMKTLGGLVGFQDVPKYVTVHPRMFFPIFVDPRRRDEINTKLNENGVDTRVCWPPVHKQPYHGRFFPGESYPNAERASASVTTIPMGNGLLEEDALYVAETLKKIMERLVL